MRAGDVPVPRESPKLWESTPKTLCFNPKSPFYPCRRLLYQGDPWGECLEGGLGTGFWGEEGVGGTWLIPPRPRRTESGKKAKKEKKKKKKKKHKKEKKKDKHHKRAASPSSSSSPDRDER